MLISCLHYYPTPWNHMQLEMMKLLFYGQQFSQCTHMNTYISNVFFWCILFLLLWKFIVNHFASANWMLEEMGSSYAVSSSHLPIQREAWKLDTCPVFHFQMLTDALKADRMIFHSDFCMYGEMWKEGSFLRCLLSECSRNFPFRKFYLLICNEENPQ